MAVDANASAPQTGAPLLLLHGFAQSAASWDPVRALIDDRPTVALDWPGCGTRRGTCDLATLTLDAHVDLLLQTIKDLAARYPDRPAPIVVGYSMGGRVLAAALVRLVNQTDQVDTATFPWSGVVLESAGLGPADEADRASTAQRNAAWADRLRTDGVAAFFDYWETLPLFASQQQLPEVVRANIRAERLAHDAESLALALEEAGAHRMPLCTETLAALNAASAAGVPIRFLAGGLDQKYRALAEAIGAFGSPNASAISSIIVPDVGHNIHLEAPKRFADLLREFSAECASTAGGGRTIGR